MLPSHKVRPNPEKELRFFRQSQKKRNCIRRVPMGPEDLSSVFLLSARNRKGGAAAGRRKKRKIKRGKDLSGSSLCKFPSLFPSFSLDIHTPWVCNRTKVAWKISEGGREMLLVREPAVLFRELIVQRRWIHFGSCL